MPVRGVLTRTSLSICRKAAEFLIGVGAARVQRVLSGRADGRTKGMRLPNSGVPLTISPMAVCLRFLWRKYHFDAEGLPDRFSLQWHDAETLTIGPNQTLVPARSASSALDFDADRVQDPKHSPMDYFLSKAKSGTHTTNSGNYFSTLVARAGWSGSVGVMWRLSHDPVRHFLHARKPMAIAMDNISLKKGIPMKVLWMKGSKVDLPKPAEDPNPQGSAAVVPAAA